MDTENLIREKIAKAPIALPSLGVPSTEYKAMVRQRDFDHKFYLILIKEALPELAKKAGYKSPEECEACEDTLASGMKQLFGGK